MVNIESLSFGYGNKPLFKNLSMKLEEGNIYGLLGLNGAGKTSLLKLVSGLIFPEEGKTDVLGEEPRRRRPAFLSRIFLLMEDFKVPNVSQREYLMSRSPFYPNFDHEKFKRYLQEFGIPNNKKLSKLSFGQKKKFFIAFGLASNCELVLMDEPTNGLDIPSKTIFRSLIAEALSDDRTFIISTHQVRDVNALIDPIIILNEGQILFSHSMAEVTEHIRMTYTAAPPAAGEPGLIYTQTAVGGYCSVWLGKDEHPVDLEVLFNAVIANPQIITKELADESGN